MLAAAINELQIVQAIIALSPAIRRGTYSPQVGYSKDRAVCSNRDLASAAGRHHLAFSPGLPPGGTIRSGGRGESFCSSAESAARDPHQPRCLPCSGCERDRPEWEN